MGHGTPWEAEGSGKPWEDMGSSHGKQPWEGSSMGSGGSPKTSPRPAMGRWEDRKQRFPNCHGKQRFPKNSPRGFCTHWSWVMVALVARRLLRPSNHVGVAVCLWAFLKGQRKAQVKLGCKGVVSCKHSPSSDEHFFSSSSFSGPIHLGEFPATTRD